MLITVSRACPVDQNNGNMIRDRMRNTALKHSSASALSVSKHSDRENHCIAATCTAHYCSRQILLLLLLLDHFVQILRWPDKKQITA